MNELIEKKLLIDIDLAPKWDNVYSGMCLISNSEIFMLLNFNEESNEFDGFTIFKFEDVQKYREWEKEEYIELKNNNSIQQLESLELKDFIDFNTSLTNLTSELVAIYTYDDLDAYFVGKVLTVNNDSVELQLIDEEAKWLATEVFDFKDISYIGFGTEYEKDLMKNVLQHAL